MYVLEVYSTVHCTPVQYSSYILYSSMMVWGIMNSSKSNWWATVTTKQRPRLENKKGEQDEEEQTNVQKKCKCNNKTKIIFRNFNMYAPKSL